MHALASDDRYKANRRLQIELQAHHRVGIGGIGVGAIFAFRGT